jgi:hypothetical protein
MSAPRLLERGEAGVLRLKAVSAGGLSGGSLKLRILETREGAAVRHRLNLGGYFRATAELSIDTSQSGFVSFETRRYWAVSLMGLFSFPLKGREKAGTLILPPAVRPPRTVLLPQSVNLVPKPGGGFSEERDIRPYRVGDPINSIHWKLTAKTGGVIVREALTLPSHSRLVFCKSWSSDAQRETILGRLRWISEYLLEHGCPHYVRLGEAAVSEIVKPGDLAEYLYSVLSGENRFPLSGDKLPRRFTWVFRIDAKEGKG